jgi:uncharacterized membrane protein
VAVRRDLRSVVIHSVSGFAMIVIWLLWAQAISQEVFPIRTDVHIDIYGQLHHVLARPLEALEVLFRTIARYKLYYLDILVGGVLGSEQTRFPRVLVVITYIFFIGAAFVACERFALRRIELAFTSVILVGTILIVFLLLYMQYTALDSPMIDGIQSRYFLPLLPIGVAFFRKYKVPFPSLQIISVGAFCWFLASSAVTINLMMQRYWASPQVSVVRFGDPYITADEP